MKKNDLIFILAVAVLLLPFVFIKPLFAGVEWATAHHPFIMSFLKFGILATLGEMLGLRIRTGSYNAPGFGALPRAITWGFLGMMINAGFIIFGSGSYNILLTLGIGTPDGTPTYAEMMKMSIFSTHSWYHALAAFVTSFMQNTLFAPVFMIIHKISDLHILRNGGTLRGYFTRPCVTDLIASLDWRGMWRFLFKRTIPLFWIPAHTVTYLLPAEFRILFAALLGVILGVFMSVNAKK